MSYTAGVILACGAMAVVIGMAHQIWLYTRGHSLITRRQFVLRIVNGLLLLTTVAMIFAGSAYRPQDLRLALLLWAVLTVLPVAVIILALVDLREIQRVRHQRQAELYQHLAQLQSELRDKGADKR
ncbi:MAG: hypothetical protein HPY69_00895 [Armatimonadetes bacterium]|nr:hypothetical protein [Armatimonadota bacterium]